MCKNADIEMQDAEMPDPSEQSTEADIEILFIYCTLLLISNSILF